MATAGMRMGLRRQLSGASTICDSTAAVHDEQRERHGVERIAPLRHGARHPELPVAGAAEQSPRTATALLRLVSGVTRHGRQPAVHTVGRRCAAVVPAIYDDF